MAEDESTPQSADSSQRGLGNMAFIRSVIDHHKKGGDADEIENEYHRLAQEGGAGADGAADTGGGVDHELVDMTGDDMDQEVVNSNAPCSAPPSRGGPSSSLANVAPLFRPSQKVIANDAHAPPIRKSVPATTGKTSAQAAAATADDPWEAHANATRRQPGIPIPIQQGQRGINNNNAPSGSTRPAGSNPYRPHHQNVNGPASLGGAQTTNPILNAPTSSTAGTGVNDRPPPPYRVGLAKTTAQSAVAAPASKPMSRGGLTDEQKAMMERKRQEALRRKQQKQQQANSSAGSASTAGAGPTALGDTSSASNGNNGSRYFAKTTPPNPYNPYQR
jgi:hypothetical protein